MKKKDEYGIQTKKKKTKFVDDGRTVADMNVEGMPCYRGKNYEPDKMPKLTRAERRAVFIGTFLSMIKPLLCTICGLGITAILIWLWLR